MTLLERIDHILNMNKTLNKDIFDGDHLYPEVHDQLLVISQEFIKFLKIPVGPEDIILTGSMVGYNYNEDSDIDIHIIIDFSKISGDPVLISEFFLAKKGIWNSQRDIFVKGHPIEIYVQSKTEELVSSGVYSLVSNEFIIKPKLSDLNELNVDESTVNKKVKQLHYDINSAIDSSDIDCLTKIKSKIKKLRKSGLHEHGEFSVENLTFKSLRNDGTIKKLMDAINELYDKQLSLENVQNESILDLLKPMTDKESLELDKVDQKIINDVVNQIYHWSAMDHSYWWAEGKDRFPSYNINSMELYNLTEWVLGKMYGVYFRLLVNTYPTKINQKIEQKLKDKILEELEKGLK
jgi:predicted nucleotidyltransferase